MVPGTCRRRLVMKWIRHFELTVWRGRHAPGNNSILRSSEMKPGRNHSFAQTATTRCRKGSRTDRKHGESNRWRGVIKWETGGSRWEAGWGLRAGRDTPESLNYPHITHIESCSKQSLKRITLDCSKEVKINTGAKYFSENVKSVTQPAFQTFKLLSFQDPRPFNLLAML